MHVKLKKQIHIFIPKSNSKIKKKLSVILKLCFPTFTIIIVTMVVAFGVRLPSMIWEIT